MENQTINDITKTQSNFQTFLKDCFIMAFLEMLIHSDRHIEEE